LLSAVSRRLIVPGPVIQSTTGSGLSLFRARERVAEVPAIAACGRRKHKESGHPVRLQVGEPSPLMSSRTFREIDQVFDRY
jgi:hypothetical protein